MTARDELSKNASGICDVDEKKSTFVKTYLVAIFDKTFEITGSTCYHLVENMSSRWDSSTKSKTGKKK